MARAMTTKEAGRKGGKSTSKAKRLAARENLRLANEELARKRAEKLVRLRERP